ncbi:Two-component response regulator-like PRR95 [Apostasia shenzhenica]|uniref:Two-component response regulator-like PRR95 n=1 Tax=Apostasia shenzhenica TaxID=1088818 RepID=A0A2I0B954_9ASPA|nr:Two-component response regulator-like PRR95 [Apostasia shenzhenica]
MGNDAQEEWGQRAPGARSLAVSPLGAAAAAVVQRQGVRWDRFLPRRSIRVLLVEQDDSTRHIVAALLRKCSYHVVVAADGLKAWEAMMERNYRFDLVLAEVEMPSLSGIALLTRIVGALECKNIPVIMMSSEDSIGVVLKCMLKGAVDFLVKPLRKNELRNLWQHVWRRHCSNSYTYASDNNAPSNHISSNAGERSQTGENCNDQSDAESLESNSETKSEAAEKLVAPAIANDDCLLRARLTPEQPVNDMTTLSKLDEIGGLRDQNFEVGDLSTLPVQVSTVEIRRHTSSREVYNGSLKSAECDITNSSLHCQRSDPEEFVQNMVGIDPFENGNCATIVLKIVKKSVISGEGSYETVRTFQSNSSESSQLEQSLRRPQLNAFVQHQSKEKGILNHSNASAFSRYDGKNINSTCKATNSSSAYIRTIEHVNQSSVNVNSHILDSRKSSFFPPRGECNDALNLQMFSDRNIEDAGLSSSGAQLHDAFAGTCSSREDNVFHQTQLDFIPLPISVGAVSFPSFCSGYSQVVQPISNKDMSIVSHSTTIAKNGKFQMHSAQAVHHGFHFGSDSRSIEFLGHDLSHPLPHCERINQVESGELEDISYPSQSEQVCQSDSWSKDILKGSGETDVAASACCALKSGNGSAAKNCCKNGQNLDRSYREAALIKFRLKRKDRCFEKKVRYHSRKMLAEQRPRVKGQFVRQKISEKNTEEAEG